MSDYDDFRPGYDDDEMAWDGWCDDDLYDGLDDEADDAWYDYEPDIDAQFEFDSSMASVGWGTDEDYGYFGEDY